MKKITKGIWGGICAVVLGTILILSICSCQNVKSEPSVPEWCKENTVFAHALGTIDGRSETNSLEALEESYERGFKVFETDICLSSDDYLVLRHDFAADSYYTFEQAMDDTPVMSKDEFLSTPINGIYTPILFDDIVDFMSKHDDVYIITDTKSTDEKTVLKQFVKLKEVVDRKKDPELYERIIVQIYNYDMKKTIDKVFKFDNYIFTLYQLGDADYNKVAKYCRENGIAVVTVPMEKISKEKSALLHKNGITVCTHTVNRIKSIESLNLYHGIEGFYTDYVSPEDLQKYGFKRKEYEKDGI